jgi:hypothetical protein
MELYKQAAYKKSSLLSVLNGDAFQSTEFRKLSLCGIVDLAHYVSKFAM